MLKQQIQSDVTNALKQGSQEVAGVLRLVLSSIHLKEKEKRYKISLGHSQTGEAKDNPNVKEEDLNKKSELSDEEVISVLSSEIKKRKDAIALYQKGKRQELAQKEQQEIDMIKKYLPEQLSSEEIKKLIEESIQKVGAKEMKDMGKVMADLNPKIKGKADGGEVSKIVKELLSK